MPKVCEKKQLLKFLEKLAVNELLILEVFGENKSLKQQKENKILDELIYTLGIAQHFRYAARFLLDSVPKSKHFVNNILPNLDEGRFRALIRLSWTNFAFVLDEIRNDEVFQGPRSCKQFPVEVQLLVVLYRLGSCGEGASISKIASLFGIGDGGTIQIITNRVFKSILRLKNKFLNWPDDDERMEMVSKTFYELPHCVGYVDGTEIKPAEKPFNSEDPEAYYSRKQQYSIKVQAVCDYKKSIRHMVIGYPGSVHDSRIYNNCDLSTKATEFLKAPQWLVGDSAYKLTASVITPYRSNSTEGTIEERAYFNKTLSTYRIRIEHCFGQLKERFNSLKELKISINGDRSVKFVCRWILVCAILQNIVVKRDEKDDAFELISDSSIEQVDESDEPENTVEYFSVVEGEVKRRALLEILKECNY